MEILTHLHRLFAAPVFPDEEATRKAVLLNTVLWSMMIMTAIYALGALFTAPLAQLPRIMLPLLALLLIVSLHLPLKQGKLQLTGWALVSGIWVVLTLAAFTGGGVSTPGFYAYLIVILLAGLLLNGRATAFVTGLCVIAGIIMLYAEAGSFLPNVVYTPPTIWVANTVIFATAALLVSLAVRSNYTAIQNYRQELKERRLAETLLHESQTLLLEQKNVLEMIAAQRPLTETLHQLLMIVEAQDSEMLCSILLLDADGVHLRHGAAPRLPKSYMEAIDGSAIGPDQGSCGTAAFTGKPVIVTDITTSPLWVDYAELALSHNLRACWSTPIFDSKQQVRGTFAIYYREPRPPSEYHLSLIEMVTHIAAIAIERKQIEEALHQSEVRNRALLEAIPDLMFLLSREGVFLDFHAPDPSLLLVPPHRIIGRSMEDILPPFLTQELHHRMECVLNGSKIEFMEYTLPLPAGERLFESRIVPVGQERVLLIVRDVTESKQRQRKLEAITSVSAAMRTAETQAEIFAVILDQIAALLGMATVALILRDPITGEGIIHQARGDFARTIGMHLPPGKGLAGYVMTTRQAHKTTDTQILVYPHLVTNIRGLAGIPLMTREGVLGALIIGHREREISDSEIQLLLAIADIAANAIRRTTLHEQTQAQARQMTHIMEAVPDGLVLLNQDYQIVAVNPAAAHYLVLLTDTRPGGYLKRLGEKAVTAFLERPSPGTLAHEVKINGRLFEIVAHPITTETQTEGWVLVVHDATEARQLQERTQQQERLAVVGQMAAGIAHDFNNVMSVIVLYSQLLQKTAQLSPKNYERLTIIYKQAEHATHLIEQILDFSRRSVMARTPVDFLSFLKELITLWQRTLPENIQLELNYDPKAYVVNADPTRLQQALMNLTVNARDAMPHGGNLQLHLSQLSLPVDGPAPLLEMKPGEWVCLTMTDSGDGISSEVLPHIFEPFFTTKIPGQGAGLGLAQVYGIINQHDGHITVRSQLGQGTTFTIYLPLVQATPVPIAPETSFPTRADKKAVILVVEDDPIVSQTIQEVLETAGYQALLAENGRSALEQFKNCHAQIDLVLSDMVMPEMGGMELYLALKTAWPDVKLILMSGYPLEDGGKALLEQGVVAWLQKPVSLTTMLKKVEEVLQSNE